MLRAGNLKLVFPVSNKVEITKTIASACVLTDVCDLFGMALAQLVAETMS